MKPRQNSENGVAILEFAIIAILFFLFLFGIIEFGILMFNQQVLANAAREGARMGVVARPHDYKVSSSAITTAVVGYAQNNIITFGDKNFSVNAQFSSGLQHCKQFQDELTVSVSYDYSFLYLPFVKKTIRSKSVMICE